MSFFNKGRTSDVGLVAGQGRQLNVNVLDGHRVDGRREAVDVGVSDGRHNVLRRLAEVSPRRRQRSRPLRRHRRRRRHDRVVVGRHRVPGLRHDAGPSDAGAHRPQGGGQGGSAKLRRSAVIRVRLVLVPILLLHHLLLLLLLLVLQVLLLYVLLKFLDNPLLLRVVLRLVPVMFDDVLLLLLLLLPLRRNSVWAVNVSRWTRNDGVDSVFVLLERRSETITIIYIYVVIE